MDKLLIEEFNKMYFGKRAIDKRMYNIEDSSYIWNELLKKRKEGAINTSLELGVKKDFIWYNSCQKIENLIREIEGIITNDITKYIPKRYREKLYKENKLREYGEVMQNNTYISIEDFDNLILSLGYKCRNNDLNKVSALLQNQPFDIEATLRQLNEYLQGNNSHPLIKSAIIYYYLINQQFQNSNIVANVSTYCYLKQNGYNNIFYQSLFNELTNDKLRYNKAINESLEYCNDATYFILFYLEVLNRIVKTLSSDIAAKFGKKIIIDIVSINNIEILDRQLNFVLDNIDKGKDLFTIADYKQEANVVYETARTDLNSLITLGFFKISKSGKKFLYHLNDIGTIIDNLQY